jgi:recombination protein RecT
MSTALQQTAPQPPAKTTLRGMIQSPAYQARFKEVLGDKAQQFCTSLINVGQTMQDVEPTSIIQSAMIAAALDLPVDKNLGFAWIVPFKKGGGPKMAQFQMGFKGFIQLGLRSGQYKRMNARAINAEAMKGYDEVGEPIIDWPLVDESKPIVGYVFAFSLVNGFSKVAYWPKTRVEEHAKRYSQSFRSGYDSPWKSHFDEMALKTVIKNELSRWGIMSIQMQEAISKDQGVINAEGTVSFPDNEAEPERPKLAKKAPNLLGGASDLDKLTALMTKEGIDEAKLITHLRGLQVIDESLSTLAEVQEVSPKAITAVVKDWESIARQLSEPPQ